MEHGAKFDADGFGIFLSEQRDLGKKWAPRYVRIAALPVGATNKIDKRALRADRWYTDDPVFWRPAGELRYRRFDADDLRALEARFREHGRADAIGRP